MIRFLLLAFFLFHLLWANAVGPELLLHTQLASHFTWGDGVTNVLSASRFVAMGALILRTASGWTWPGFTFKYHVCKVAMLDNTWDRTHERPEKGVAKPRCVSSNLFQSPAFMAVI